MNRITQTATTEEVLVELGSRLKRYRLQQNQTIAEIATAAGLGSATIQRAEAGIRPELETLVRILRALGRLDTLDAFLPAPLVSPLQLAELGGHERQRAGRPRRRRRSSKPSDSEPEHG